MRTTPVLAVGLLLALAAVGVQPAAGGAGPAPAAGTIDRAAATPVDASSPPGTPAARATGPPAHAAPRQEGDACAPVSGGSPRAHPESDQLGWEAGCWADEPIVVSRSDGLNRTELGAVIARAKARIERIRQLEFDGSVTVETISRAEYRNRSGGLGNVSDAVRLHQNVKYEALFFVGEDTDAIAELGENRGASVLGYYSPQRDRIVIVTEGETAEVDEYTLVHELVHALQDQHFDLTRYNRSTTERSNAVNGLVEGDANYVEYRYTQRCDGDWACPPEPSAGETPAGFHFGIYFLNFQPYSDGPQFVATLRRDGGFAAVNEAYSRPPASTEQVIHPDRYGADEPANVTVADRSNERWRVLELDAGIDYATLGEAGLFTMLYYPAYETAGQRSIVPYRHLFQESNDLGYQYDLNYDHYYSAGWDGDRLYPYVANDSTGTNETAYVWKTVWDSEADAREFAAGYVQLLNARGAEPVEGRRNTFRIPDDREFGDAFYINRTGNQVVVVNAPTPEALPGVRAGASPVVSPTPTPSPRPTATETPTGVDQSTATPSPQGTTAPEATTGDGGIVESVDAGGRTTPGLGVGAAVAALAAAALLGWRR